MSMRKSGRRWLSQVILVLLFFQNFPLASGSPTANNDDYRRGVVHVDEVDFVNLKDRDAPKNVETLISSVTSTSAMATVSQNPQATISKISLSTAIPTAVNTTIPISGNKTATKNEQSDDSTSYVTQEAINAYEKHGDCHPAFFDLTNENLDQANISLWFNDFITSKAQQNPESYKKFGEIPFFAREIMQMSNFECNLQSKGCNTVPSCKEVISHLERRNSNLTSTQLLDQSRKIYLTFKQMDSIFKYISTMHELLGIVQSNINGFIMAIISDFTTQSSTESEVACMMAKLGYDIAFTFAETALAFGLGAVPSGTAQIVLDGKKVIETVTNKHLKGFNNYNGLIHTGISLVKDVSGTTIEIKQKQLDEEWEDDWAEKGRSNYHLVMPQAYLSGICADVGGDMPNQNWERATKMASYVSKSFMDMRVVLEKLTKALSNGNVLEMGASPLALYLHNGEMFEAVQQLKQSQSAYESVMTQLFKESLITAALTNSKCYSKCAFQPDDMKVQQVCKAKWANIKSRYCPEDNESIACQVQCFTTQSRGNREKSLIGKAALPQYSLSVDQLLKDSFHHYQTIGNSPPTLGQLAGNGSSDILTLDRTLNSKVSGLALPVCVSANVKLTNFDDKVHINLKYTQNQQFPCSCGDWTSNETPDFMARLGLGFNQTDFQTGSAKELFHQICPHNLKPLAPLSRYLAYCALGMQMPDKTSGTGPLSHPKEHPDHWVHNMHTIQTARGAHQHCDIIREQVKGMSEIDGNRMFCAKQTKEMKEVLEEARKHAENSKGSFVKGYREACRKWKKENKIKD
ncbi:hypothetical protein VTL71DRAFT_7960 [Oculimacula yallundae]|uniref:Uncharacterized protein n=1 Tax=Oculimacula yallundae TaxID=86028 RepID=A0ABR4CWG2_9HELO